MSALLMKTRSILTTTPNAKATSVAEPPSGQRVSE